MVIRIIDLVSGANTADDGDAVYQALKHALGQPGQVIVCFAGIQTATSSFVNASFVRLLDDCSFSDIKTRLRVTNSTRQINDMIKRRMTKSALSVAAT